MSSRNLEDDGTPTAISTVCKNDHETTPGEDMVAVAHARLHAEHARRPAAGNGESITAERALNLPSLLLPVIAISVDQTPAH